WQQIEADLDKSIEYLANDLDYPEGERTWVNLYTAMALRSRVYLFRQHWRKAGELSSLLIAQTGNHELLEDLNGVFFANSKEALWQISPVRGSSIFPTNTNEANILIIYTRFGRPFGSIKVNNDFFDSFDPNDNRRNQWISQFEDDLYY